MDNQALDIDGLGRFAKDHQIGPQLTSKLKSNMVFTEREWKLAEVGFRTPGKGIDYYMNYAYTMAEVGKDMANALMYSP